MYVLDYFSTYSFCSSKYMHDWFTGLRSATVPNAALQWKIKL